MAANTSVTTVLKGDSVTIPPELRKRFGLTDGSVVVIEADEQGIRLRPIAEPDAEVEIYTPERIAEFLLNNVFDEDDYARAVEEVREMGIDPDAIPHVRPDGTVR